VVGPNGAGKTALLNCISGVFPPTSGVIVFKGSSLAKLRPHQISRLGIGRSFQTTEHFKQFTALEFVLLGRIAFQVSSLVLTMLALPLVVRSEHAERELAQRVLESFGLSDFANQRLASLPYGVQKRVDIARALACEPGLVLLDEPTSGTAADERPAIEAMMDRLRGRGLTVLVVDHDVGFVSRTCDRIMVMDAGKEVVSGPPAEVLNHPEVRRIYVGSATTHA
jgi:branched-chain amino acid transport system ATP-binding protein